jgi:hypothetical protein
MNRPRFTNPPRESHADGPAIPEHVQEMANRLDIDEAASDSASSPGRRMAIRSLGAVSLALLAVQRLGESIGAKQSSNNNNDVGAEHRRRHRRRRAAPVRSFVAAGPIQTLPVSPTIGEQITSIANCGGGSALLGCAYDVSTTGIGPDPATALQNTMPDIVPNSPGRSCTATLLRIGQVPAGTTAAAQIQAYAICRQ